MFDDLTLAIVLGVPLITAFIGYSTNWAAVKMIFHPASFVGVGRVGWQGVIPAHNARFADDIAARVGQVISPRDLAAGFDPDEIEALLADRLDAEMPIVVREAAEVIRPGLWDELAPEAQQVVIAQLRAEGSAMARQLLGELTELSDELLDLEALVADLLSGENADRLTRLFRRLGHKELRFIELYGGVFGFLVGCLQVLLYGVFGQRWTMPLVGAVVGLGTNWLAIQMIFRPLEPRRFLGLVTYQGMFPKRQAEIAREFGAVAEEEIFTPENLFRVLTEGEAGTRIARLVLERVSERIDQQRPMLEMLAQQPITDEQVETVKALVVTRVTRQLPEVRAELDPYLRAQLGVARTVESRMAVMTKPELERLLRGIFEEDEVTLILIGGVLGGLVGVLQAGLVLA
ncbi:MAG TPA: DUF445 family protein [Acidimicrobiales bacterium]|nr:DUF445 family protein [Acidimicrobiales bacterium]